MMVGVLCHTWACVGSCLFVFLFSKHAHQCQFASESQPFLPWHTHSSYHVILLETSSHVTSCQVPHHLCFANVVILLWTFAIHVLITDSCKVQMDRQCRKAAFYRRILPVQTESVASVTYRRTHPRRNVMELNRTVHWHSLCQIGV